MEWIRGKLDRGRMWRDLFGMYTEKNDGGKVAGTAYLYQKSRLDGVISHQIKSH